MGKLVALQKPARPSGLDALSDRSFYHLWMNLRLSHSSETLEPYMETLADVMGFSGEHFKQLVLDDAESLLGVSAGQRRVVTEGVYRPKRRRIEEYRRLVRELHAESLSPERLGIHRIYENEIARARDLSVVHGRERASPRAHRGFYAHT
ncbi:MAG: hypothetical protein BMS9Abin37_2773 [Acidobacteriota bacterium]|nr:MAG: hypothetical protein BMS9Abin37_2773 [Acidobacteriota bacterium]